MIYFIQDESAFFIKIGFTASHDATDRLKDLQTGCPSGLVLLYSMPGDMALEQELHRRFAVFRIRGEWFQPAPEIFRFVLDHAVSVATSCPVTEVVAAERLLSSLESNGFKVVLHDDNQTIIVGPKHRLTPTLADAIRAAKPTLRDMLAARQSCSVAIGTSDN